MIRIHKETAPDKISIEINKNSILAVFVLMETLLENLDEAMYADESVPFEEQETFDDLCQLIHELKSTFSMINSRMTGLEKDQYVWLDRNIS